MANTLSFAGECAQQQGPVPTQTTCWWRPPGPVKGYALAIHGLNARPSVMDDWGRALLSKGVATLRVGLRGHTSGKIEDFQQVTATQWAKEGQEYVAHVSKLASDMGVSWGFVGHSLGAVVGLQGTVLGDHQWQQPQWALLIAPALSVKPFPQVVKMFKYWPKLVVPSLSPKAYRAVEKGTPVAAYTALFQLKDELDGIDVEEWHRLRPTKVHLVLHKKDELIDYNASKKWAEDRGFIWPVYDLQTTRIEIDGKKIPHHLCVDKKTLGEKNWDMVLQLLYASYSAL